MSNRVNTGLTRRVGYVISGNLHAERRVDFSLEGSFYPWGGFQTNFGAVINLNSDETLSVGIRHNIESHDFAFPFWPSSRYDQYEQEGGQTDRCCDAWWSAEISMGYNTLSSGRTSSRVINCDSEGIWGWDEGAYNATSYSESASFQVIVEAVSNIVADIEIAGGGNYPCVKTPETLCEPGWAPWVGFGWNYGGSLPLRAIFAEVPDLSVGDRQVSVIVKGELIASYSFPAEGLPGTPEREAWEQKWTNPFRGFSASLSTSELAAWTKPDNYGNTASSNTAGILSPGGSRTLAGNFVVSGIGTRNADWGTGVFDPQTDGYASVPDWDLWTGYFMWSGNSMSLFTKGVAVGGFDQWGSYHESYENCGVSVTIPSYRSRYNGAPELINGLPRNEGGVWTKQFSPHPVTPILEAQMDRVDGEPPQWSPTPDGNGGWSTLQTFDYKGSFSISGGVGYCETGDMIGWHYNRYVGVDGMASFSESFSDAPTIHPYTLDYPFVGKYTRHGRIKVMNADDMGEMGASIPAAGDCPDLSYWDDRCGITIDANPANIDDPEAWSIWKALKVSTPNASKRMIEFGGESAELAKWTTHNCTLSAVVESGKTYLKIENVTAGAYITRTYDPDNEDEDIILSGGRLAELEYSSTGTAAIEAEIAGRKWDVAVGQKWDVLNPKYPTLETGATQSIIEALHPSIAEHTDPQPPYDGDVPWDWGLFRPGTIRIGNLEVGKDYVLRGLKLHRVAESAGGQIHVMIYPQGSYARVRGSEDGKTWIDTGTVPFETYDLDNWWQTMGAVIVDGLVAGEIVIRRDSYRLYETGICVWGHDHSDIDSVWSAFPSRDTGFIKVEPLTHTYEFSEGDWLAHLYGAHYSGYDSINEIISALLVDEVLFPVGWDIPMRIQKFYGGQALVRVVEKSGNDGPFTVNISGGSGVHAIDTTISTDKLGVVFTPSLNWQAGPTIRANTTDSPSISGLQINSRTLSVATLRAVKELQNATHIDVDIGGFLGEMVCAFIRDSKLLTMFSTNHGKTWTPPVEVDTNVMDAPCLLRTRSSVGRWGVSWTSGTQSKVAWSDDLFSTKQVIPLISGLKNVRCRICPQTGIMIIAGWRESDGCIVSAHSTDHGVTTSALSVVCSAPEQAFGLEIANDLKHTWIVTCLDSSSNVRVYGSDNAGTAWVQIS